MASTASASRTSSTKKSAALARPVSLRNCSTAGPRCSSLRLAMITVPPSLASSRAMANPIPVPPPVMMPTRFSNVFSGSMARDDTSGREVVFDSCDDLREIVSDGCPDGRDTNIVIAVKEPVSHACHIGPPQREDSPGLSGNVSGSFTDDADAVDHSILLLRVEDELRFGHVANI